MGTHSSTLAWKIPWMEEPGGLQSLGSRRVGHDWATSLSLSCIGEGNGTHSSVLAWRIPGMGESGRLPSMGLYSWTWLRQLSSSSIRNWGQIFGRRLQNILRDSSHLFLQGIFLTQGSNLHLLHWQAGSLPWLPWQGHLVHVGQCWYWYNIPVYKSMLCIYKIVYSYGRL